MRPKPDFLPRMRGATGSVAGRRGLVPKPAAADNVKYLKGDGSWSALSNASAATDAEAAAGTSSTTFVTPATAGLAAAKVTNARAPRQALAFDGAAACAVANLPAFGTGDFSVFGLVTCADFSISRVVISSATNGFALRVNTSGLIEAVKVNVAITNTSTSALTAAKAVWIGYVRAAGVGTFYINAVSAGSAADASDYSLACTIVGTASNSVSSIYSLPVFNRALSAAEVLALYEQGAPAAADYATGGVGVEAIATAVDSTFAPNSGNWGTWNNGTLTQPGGSGTKLVYSVGGYNPAFGLYINSNYLTVGKWYTLAITLADFVGGTTCVVEGSATSLVAGANTVVFQATTTKPKILLSGTTTGFSIAPGISIKTAGLLCAPEATAPGNGYQWKDMSGNMADITLPGSGVSWVLPDTRPNSVRERLTWAGTHERKYLLGSERAFPSGSLLTDVTTKASVGSSGSGLSIGTFNDGSRWVAANAFTTAKKVHALVNRMPASDSGLDHNLNIDPDNANYTGSIDVEVRYVVTKGTQ